jgi:hypothetical protein
MKLDLTTIPVTLTGTQVLQISGSPVSEIQVTFPAGFQLGRSRCSKRCRGLRPEQF